MIFLNEKIICIVTMSDDYFVKSRSGHVICTKCKLLFLNV